RCATSRCRKAIIPDVESGKPDGFGDVRLAHERREKRWLGERQRGVSDDRRMDGGEVVEDGPARTHRDLRVGQDAEGAPGTRSRMTRTTHRDLRVGQDAEGDVAAFEG